jgi:hypothetical protein
MRTPSVIISLVLGLLIVPSLAAAGDQHYVLPFIPTQNWPAAQATLEIQVSDHGQTHVHLKVQNAAPNTLYTLWTVFNELTWPLPTSAGAVPSTPAQLRVDPVYGPFPLEGNAVSPVAPLGAAFTDGMGLDPGVTFFTDDHGNADADINLDYDLVQAAPVSNRHVIFQSICTTGRHADGSCASTPTSVFVTTTWLRQFVADFSVHDRQAECANYAPVADPQANLSFQPGGDNALLWQCMDPATADGHGRKGRSRVYWCPPAHFRLAAHLDELTHGFIGGNGTDHRIDMVGRMQDMQPVH